MHSLVRVHSLDLKWESKLFINIIVTLVGYGSEVPPSPALYIRQTFLVWHGVTFNPLDILPTRSYIFEFFFSLCPPTVWRARAFWPTLLSQSMRRYSSRLFRSGHMPNSNAACNQHQLTNVYQKCKMFVTRSINVNKKGVRDTFITFIYISNSNETMRGLIPRARESPGVLCILSWQPENCLQKIAIPKPVLTRNFVLDRDLDKW